MRKIDGHRLMYQYRQLPPNLVVIETQNENGPKEKQYLLKPEQEKWPINPGSPERNFIVPDIPILSEGAPKIAELVKNLPGSVTIRQMRSQPHIEQKLVHVTLDGTVTGVTLGEGSTLQPCTPENHQWFRLEAVDTDTVPQSNSEIIISTEQGLQVASSDPQNSDSSMTVFEIDNSNLQSAGLAPLSDSRLSNSTDIDNLTFVSDPPLGEYESTNAENVEFIRKNRGLLSVSATHVRSEYDSKGRKIVRPTKTWVNNLVIVICTFLWYVPYYMISFFTSFKVLQRFSKIANWDPRVYYVLSLSIKLNCVCNTMARVRKI